MNSYQRIVRDGQVVQKGCIDTHEKFKQLMGKTDLRGKAVLDVGCNCGEMCRLAKDAGATKVCGIDTKREFVLDARRLNPDLSFGVRSALNIAGHGYDIVIASAMFHYVADKDRFLNQLARVGNKLIMDVWLSRKDGSAMMELSHRGSWIPNMAGFAAMAERSWSKIKWYGEALSPDNTYRRIVHLSDPKPTPAKAVVIYGPGSCGKSSHARDLLGYEHLQLDVLFMGWRRTQEPKAEYSVRRFVKEVWEEGGTRLQRYVAYHSKNVLAWLGRRQNLDVVIEGFDMLFPKYREMVLGHLSALGWAQVEQIEKRRDV
jgi:SAM-dependent methyltransferase